MCVRVCVCVNACMCVFLCMCVCVCVFERERERERDNACVCLWLSPRFRPIPSRLLVGCGIDCSPMGFKKSPPGSSFQRILGKVRCACTHVPPIGNKAWAEGGDATLTKPFFLLHMSCCFVFCFMYPQFCTCTWRCTSHTSLTSLTWSMDPWGSTLET